MRYKVEALLGGQLIDPSNIVAGETVQFQVAGYTANNTRIVQSASDWTTTDAFFNSGVLSANGSFTATNFGGPFTITAVTSTGVQSGSYTVKPQQALVSGTVGDGQGRFAEGVKVLFFDASSTQVGSSVVQSNGFFRASVPVSATTFEIDTTSFNHSNYYNEYFFDGKWFLPGSCRGALPALSNGVTTNLGTIILPATTATNGASVPPPPPPSPCL